MDTRLAKTYSLFHSSVLCAVDLHTLLHLLTPSQKLTQPQSDQPADVSMLDSTNFKPVNKSSLGIPEGHSFLEVVLG